MLEGQVFNVAVIGGGPAGAAAAIAFARLGRRVVLLHDAPRREWRVGEIIAGDARDALEALGMAAWLEGGAALASDGVASCWGSPNPVVTHALTNPYGGGWHIDRAAFERALLERASALGVSLWRARAAKVTRAAGVFHIHGGQARGLARARFVVDATGSRRWVARRLGVAQVTAGYRQVAVAALLTAPRELSAMLLLEACPDGWWYSAPLPDGRAVAAFVTDVDLLGRGESDRFARALAGATFTRKRLERSRICEIGVQPCGPSRLATAAGPGWVAIGDAAMVLDPLSSHGIAKALRAGLTIARAATVADTSPDLVLADYARQCDAEVLAHARILRSFHEKEQRWAAAPFWSRRQGEARGPERGVTGRGAS